MNDYDYEAAVYNDEVYCIDCLPDGVTPQSKEVTPVFACSAWDVYPVCCVCGCEYDYVVKLEND